MLCSRAKFFCRGSFTNVYILLWVIKGWPLYLHVSKVQTRKYVSLCLVNTYHTIVVTVNHQRLPGLKIHILLPPITYLQNNVVNTMKYHYFLSSDCFFIKKVSRRYYILLLFQKTSNFIPDLQIWMCTQLCTCTCK